MNCRATKKQFSAYLEAELSEAGRRCVAAHLERCERCARELEAFRKTMTLLRWIPPVEADDAFTRRVVLQARADAGRMTPALWLRSWWESLQLQAPWRGLDLPVPALASAGGLGLAAGVLLTLRLIGLPATAAESANPPVPDPLASKPGVVETTTAHLAPQPGAAATLHGAALAAGSTRPDVGGRADAARPAGYAAATDPWVARRSVQDIVASYVGRAQAWSGSGALRSLAQRSSRGAYAVPWQSGAAAGQRVEGPAPVTVVEYVLRRVRIQPRSTPARELPAGLHVENGYVTF